MSTHGWAEREHGVEVEGRRCACSRRLYVTLDSRENDPRGFTEDGERRRRCNGCGEVEAGCFCPPAWEFA